MKKQYGLFISFAALILCAVIGCTAFATVRTSFADEVKGTGKSAYLIDAGTGTVIYERNAKERLPIASMVKIMTLLVSFEEIENGKATLDDDVSVSEYAASMGGSQAFLDAGGTYKMSELLKSVVVASANDSCVAIGEHLFGSVDGLIERMNKKVSELGLSDTYYVNCTGLPAEGQYSCASDVAVMFSHLIKHEKFYEYAREWMYDFVHPSGRVTGLTNTNKLVRFYDGCDGGKTGYTAQAGSCLAATAKRNGLRLISVIIGADNSKVRNKEVSDLFNYGFANYENRQVVIKGSEVGTVNILLGKSDCVKAIAEDEYNIFGKKGELKEVTTEFVPEKTCAPVKKGDIVGYVRIMNGSEEIGRVAAVSDSDVSKRGYGDVLNDQIRNW